jgi:hypothetical protein
MDLEISGPLHFLEDSTTAILGFQAPYRLFLPADEQSSQHKGLVRNKRPYNISKNPITKVIVPTLGVKNARQKSMIPMMIKPIPIALLKCIFIVLLLGLMQTSMKNEGNGSERFDRP